MRRANKGPKSTVGNGNGGSNSGSVALKLPSAEESELVPSEEGDDTCCCGESP